MIIILRNDASKEETDKLIDWLETFDIQTYPIIGRETSVIGLVGDTSVLDRGNIERWTIVESVLKVQEPYKKANRKFHPEDMIITLATSTGESSGEAVSSVGAPSGKAAREDIVIGGNKIVVAAGPCSVESSTQISGIAGAVKHSGASLLRGGAFKPRTSPYSFQGLKAEGLMYMLDAKEEIGLPIITEITNPSQIEMFNRYVDIIQVGTRNMQNFELLKQLGSLRKPILLKRGFANTIEELLMSAEYIMAGGNEQVILCERGIRTYETATRNTLDISAVPVLKKRSHLPVFVDPSHASGHAWLVEPLAKAAVAAGADGLIIEVHNDPPRALSDGQQSLTPDQFDKLMNDLRPIATA
ncbi:MAG TPA: 3-deoxy-7-phosphoheptulonate synthase, partial [Clostridiaceae bacterium]|nr:3-deoxy-7-phosphoheptulonate synthase [Clostridiaceae bacterium]